MNSNKKDALYRYVVNIQNSRIDLLYLASQYLPLISFMFHGRPHSMNGNAAASAVIFFCICNAIWTVDTHVYSLSINHINNKTKLWFLQQEQNNCKEESISFSSACFSVKQGLGTISGHQTQPLSFLSLLLRFSSVLKLLSLNSSTSSCIIKCTLNHYDKWLFVRTPLLADATSNFCCQIGSHY